MLRSAVDFQRIQSHSRSRAHAALMLRYRANELERTRYGISTGRRVGNSVVRNQVRRRLRETLRRLAGRVQPGWDILIVARTPAAQASQKELEEALTKLLTSAALLASNELGSD
jgi:ribonuclease P protein component